MTNPQPQGLVHPVRTLDRRSVPLISTVGDLTPRWFTTLLRAGGYLDEGNRVAAIAPQKVGNGLVGDSIRFQLHFDHPAPEAPASVVCKFPAVDPNSRAMGASERLYLREVRFYQAIAPVVKIRSARCYYADVDPETSEFLLVLEDLGPARGGDHIQGCTLEDAQRAVRGAAALHAPLWDAEELTSSDWNARDYWVGQIGRTYSGLFDRFCSVFASRNADTDFAVGRRFVPRIGQWFAQQKKPWAVTHGDFRLDNMLFDIAGGREPFATLDWQTMMPAPGPSDVAYFIGGCLDTDLRRTHEKALVELYHRTLLELGVTGYGFDDCWEAYRYNALMGYLIPTYAAPLVPRTERGDQMFSIWVRRTVLQIQDLDTLSLLP